MPKSSTSPTARTLKYLRAQGWACAIVEKWNAYARIRQDAFGVLDIIALRGETLGIQATNGGDGNAAKRIAKAILAPGLLAWLTAGNRFQVIAWRKLKPRGQKVGRWHPLIREIFLTANGAYTVADVSCDSQVKETTNGKEKESRHQGQREGQAQAKARRHAKVS